MDNNMGPADVRRELLSQSARASLASWMEPRLRREAGLKPQPELTEEADKRDEEPISNGLAKLAGLGVGVGLAATVSVAVGAASGGAVRLGVYPAVCIASVSALMAPALRGVGRSWIAAREEGLELLPAFGQACRRAALGIKTGLLPNPYVLGYMAAFPVGALVEVASSGSQKIQTKWGASKALIKTQQAVDAWNGKMADGMVAFERWTTEQSEAGLNMEGRAVAAREAYARIAKGWMSWSYLATLDENRSEISEWVEKSLTHQEKAIRKGFKVQISEQGPELTKNLLECVEKADKLGLDPSFRPRPGMPSLCELTRSLQLQMYSVQPPLPALDLCLGAWEARTEAQEIKAAVGSVQSAAADAPTAKLVRPRL